MLKLDQLRGKGTRNIRGWSYPSMLNVQQLVVVWVDAILERKQEETASTTTHVLLISVGLCLDVGKTFPYARQQQKKEESSKNNIEN